jgi:multiple sugar transport system substrate-binding protein
MDQKRNPSRREFLAGSAAALGSAAFATRAIAQAPAVARKVKIQWMEWMTPETGETRMREILDAFYKSEAGKSIEVERITVPNPQFHDKVIANHLANAIPDVVQVVGDWAVEFAELGVMEPLDPYLEKAGKDWVANLIKNNMVPWKGKVYLLPMTVSNYLLTYNVRKLEEAGLSGPPKTWADLEQVGPKLTNPAKNTYCFASCMGLVSPYKGPVTEIWPLIYQCNDTVMKNGKPNLTSPASIKALKFWLHQVNDLKMYAPGALTNGEKDMVEAFTSEVTAMLIWSGVSVRVAQQRNPKLKLGMVPLPEGDTYGTFGMGWNSILATRSKNKEAAWEFMRWLSGPEGSALIATAAFHPPANLKADMSALVQREPLYQVTLNVARRGRVFAEIAGMPEGPNLLRIQVEQIQEAANKRKTPEAAMEFATAEWNKVLAKYV